MSFCSTFLSAFYLTCIVKREAPALQSRTWNPYSISTSPCMYLGAQRRTQYSNHVTLHAVSMRMAIYKNNKKPISPSRKYTRGDQGVHNILCTPWTDCPVQGCD